MSSCLGFSSGLPFLVFDNPAPVFDKSKVPETPKSFLFARPFEIGNSETKLSFSGRGLWWIDLNDLWFIKTLLLHLRYSFFPEHLFQWYWKLIISMYMAVQLIMQNALTLGHWDRPVKSYDQILFWPQSAVFFSLKLGSLSTLTIHRKFNACMYMRCWHTLSYHLPDWQFELADMTAQPPHHRILLTMQWDEATQLQLIFIWVNYKRCIFFFPALIGFNKVK